MDFLEYIQRYSDVIQMTRGEGLIKQLSADKVLDLVKYLLQKAKSEDRLGYYKDLMSAAMGYSEVLNFISESELDNWEIRNRENIDNREYKINQAKNAGLKDSYRVNILDLGDYYYRSGDMPNAMKLYLRAKEITVTSDQQCELFSRMALASLHKKNISFAQNNAQKVLLLPNLPVKFQITSTIIMGIGSLEVSNYKQAAEYFLRVGDNNNSELCNNADLAGYISLCGLATFSRAAINSEILQAKSFLTLTEDEPKYIELLECFLTCKFYRLIQILEDIRAALKYDIYIGQSVNSICDEIKNKCLAQFMKAFKKIRIEELARNFCCSEQEIEGKLAKLIMDGKVDARIDAHLKIVSSRVVDEKNKINWKVLNTAKAYLKNTQLALLRMSMMQEGVVVKGK